VPIPADSLATTSVGVFAGAKKPNHSSYTMSAKPCSAKVGTVGAKRLRVGPEVASSRALPVCRCCRNSPTGPDTAATAPPIMSRIAGCVPRYGAWRSSTPAVRESSSPTKCGTEPAAGLPNAASLGFAFAQATKSRTPRTDAGTAGPTAKPKSKRTACETGTKSVTGS
jgi:hypothetical protein